MCLSQIANCNPPLAGYKHTDTPSVSRLLEQSRRLVGHFKHSNVASHALREQQKNEGVSQPLSIISEVAKRWNSTYDMLSRLDKLHDAITIILNNTVVTKAADRGLGLSGAQWKLVHAMAQALEPFRGVTDDLSTSKKVSISAILPLMFGLVGECAEEDDNPAFISSLKESLASNVPSKFNLASVHCDSAEALGAALDPRFKDLHFLNEENREAIFEELWQMLS